MLKEEKYTYNESGLRIKKEEFLGPNKKSTYYVYSGNNILFTETYINDKPIDMVFNIADMASFTHHYGEDSQEELNYYYKDHRQNRVVKTEEDGSIVSSANKFGYSSWGELDNPDATEESWFTGKKQDESGLYYFNARYYDADMGRFLQQDPAKHGLNWYTYCNNNPVNRIDPTGLITVGAEGSGGVYLPASNNDSGNDTENPIDSEPAPRDKNPIVDFALGLLAKATDYIHNRTVDMFMTITKSLKIPMTREQGDYLISGSERIVDKIIRSCGGNPLIIEDMTRGLIIKKQAEALGIRISGIPGAGIDLEDIVGLSTFAHAAGAIYGMGVAGSRQTRYSAKDGHEFRESSDIDIYTLGPISLQRHAGGVYGILRSAGVRPTSHNEHAPLKISGITGLGQQPMESQADSDRAFDRMVRDVMSLGLPAPQRIVEDVGTVESQIGQILSAGGMIVYPIGK